MPKVSVVIATYNRARLLKNTLHSIFAQTYKNIEVCVVDDASNDETSKIIDAYAVSHPIQFVRLPQNKGSSNARNIGLEKASGDFIMVWDSDDILYESAIERVMDVFSKYPELQTVSALAYESVSVTKDQSMDTGIVTKADILTKHLPNNTKIRVSRRECFEGVRYQSYNLDFMVNGYLIEKGPWYHIREYLGTITITSDSNSLTLLRKKVSQFKSMHRAPFLYAYLEHFYRDYMSYSPSRYFEYATSASAGLIMSHEFTKAKELLQKAGKVKKNFKWIAYTALSFIPGGAFILKTLYKIANFIG